MNIQNWVHWLDEGVGGKVVAVLAAGLFAIFFSMFVAYKQFQGPGNEQVFRDALIAKNLAEGKGYTLPVNYPYVAAYLQEHQDIRFDLNTDYPDLHRAPLYPFWLALGMWLLPDATKERVFGEPTLIGNYSGDFFLLAMNVILFWITCILTWWLGYRLFGKSAAWLALGGLFFSYGIWREVMEVSGVVLLMVLVLSLLHAFISLDRSSMRSSSLGKQIAWSACIGLNLAALFLTDYSAVLVVVPAIGFVWVRLHGSECWIALSSMLTVFIMVVSPWCLRNVELTDSPVGLAWSDFYLRAGDPTAEPTLIKNTWETVLPAMSFRKIIGKGLDGIRVVFSEKLWSGGAMMFVGFAICGLFYRYKNRGVDAVRWLMVFVVVTLLLLYPFFSSGESMRVPVYYLVPVMIVLGAGFLVILWDSSGNRPLWMKYMVFSGIIAVQALPLARPVLEPATHIYFRHPTYWPRIMFLLGPGVADKLQESYGLMSDIPAGLAWYSGERIWSQPEQYLDFSTIMQTQSIGALYLSPSTLDRSYFSELVDPGGIGGGGESSKVPSWGRVYEGIAHEKLPLFFPLQNSVRIMDNAVLLLNSHAQRAP